MSRDLPCLACGVVGREGRDVMFKVIEVPEYERRQVSVLLPVHASADSLELPFTVPERYVTEPRCRDEAACHDRVIAQAAAAHPATSDVLAAPSPAGGRSSAASPVPEAPIELQEPEFPPSLSDEPEEYVL